MLGFPNSSAASEGGLYGLRIYPAERQPHSKETYIGSTSDLRKRLAEHNAGKSTHTNKFKPWELLAYVALPEKHLAEKFEKYLKSGSGRAFAAKHWLIPSAQKP